MAQRIHDEVENVCFGVMHFLKLRGLYELEWTNEWTLDTLSSGKRPLGFVHRRDRTFSTCRLTPGRLTPDRLTPETVNTRDV
jgi:hypothetical protein